MESSKFRKETDGIRSALFALVLALGTGFALAGCEQDGPVENAGEQVDDAMEEAGDSMNDAADEIEDATDRG